MDNQKIQEIVAEVKRLAMDLDIKIMWAHEPGEAARKRLEEEESNVNNQRTVFRDR